MFLFDRGQFVDGVQNELAPKVGRDLSLSQPINVLGALKSGDTRKRSAA